MTYANDARAVEDPGECERRGSGFWSSVSWFSGGVARAEATEARAEDVQSARDRAPGGATCQNRFITERGARDPFAPTSATVVLEARARAEGGGADGRTDADARTRVPFEALANGRACADARAWGGGSFAFDRARGVWTGVGRDGARADVRTGDGDGAETRGGVVSEDASSVAMECDEDGVRAREARVRRYQTSYDEDVRRFASTRAKASLERVVASPRASAPTPFVSSVIERSERRARDTDACSVLDVDPAVHWIPLALDDGSTVWIETAADSSPEEQLSAWCRGAAPWPDVRTLSLSRDRTDLPPGAPGPRLEDARALEAVRDALRAVRRDALRAAVAPSDVSPSTSEEIIDALRRELTARARERDDALAECARLRDACARLRDDAAARA